MLRDTEDLERSLNYIGSAGWLVKPPKCPVFVHLSAHGANGNGLSLGQKEVSWEHLSKMLVAMLKGMDYGGKGYPGPTVLVISACDSDKQGLTRYLSRAFSKREIKSPPSYVFLISDSMVYWADAVVTWTIFYRKVLNLDFRVSKSDNKIQQFVKKLKSSGFGNLAVYSWNPNKSKYFRYPKRAE